MDREDGSALAQSGVGERLPLAALAARRAVIERLVDGDDLLRFKALCKPSGGIRVALSFSREESGHVHIDGTLNAKVSVACHRCLDAVSVELNSAFSVLGVMSDADAAQLGSKADVLQLTTEEPAMAELIEDELILALPQRTCVEANCGKTPPLTYAPQAANSDKPFRSLALLKES